MDELLGLELVVTLGTIVLGGSLLASRLHVPPPVVLLVLGLLLGIAPFLGEAHLPPELVLAGLLPALLWWESLTTSLRELRRNLRGVLLSGSLLVVVAAAVVAVVAHAFGLPWGPAWVLGAALAPTDATAVGVMARSLPRRDLTVLRGESLVNDGTALVVYGVAVGVTVGNEQLTVGHVFGLVALSYVGGVLVGYGTGRLAAAARGRLDDIRLENLVFLVTPFTAYLTAELVGASGVLAVVVAGLLMSQAGPRTGSAGTRQLANAFWGLATFLVNGALFIMVGVELQSAVRDLTSISWPRALALVAVVVVTLASVRFGFLFSAAHVIRLLDRRPTQKARRLSERARVVSTFAGFRGAVSMAAALAVPETLVSGEPFPGRDVIVFTTAAVIAATLVVQGPLLPRVVRWAHLPPDDDVRAELHLAEVRAVESALEALPGLAAEIDAGAEVVRRLREELEAHRDALHDGEGTEAARAAGQAHALGAAVVAHQRRTVLSLRDDDRIDDTVLRALQSRLDDEEIRIAGREVE